MNGRLPAPSDGPPEPSAKRMAIVRAGHALLLRHGIRKTRVEEVCADAAVSKRTFYRYFRDKDDLAIAVLAEIFEAGRARMEMLLGLECALEEKIWRILEVKAELAAETGAPFYRQALDGSTAPGRFVLQERRAWDDRVRRFYLDAQAHGQIRGDIDIDVLMVLLVRLRDLVSDLDVAGSAAGATRSAEALAKMLFYGIIPRESGAPEVAEGARNLP